MWEGPRMKRLESYSFAIVLTQRSLYTCGRVNLKTLTPALSRVQARPWRRRERQEARMKEPLSNALRRS
jgi:hypothetical protein